MWKNNKRAYAISVRNVFKQKWHDPGNIIELLVFQLILVTNSVLWKFLKYCIISSMLGAIYFKIHIVVSIVESSLRIGFKLITFQCYATSKLLYQRHF